MHELIDQTAGWVDRAKSKQARNSGSGDTFFVDSGTPFSASNAGRLIEAVVGDIGRRVGSSVYLAEEHDPEDSVRFHEDVEASPDDVVEVAPLRRFAMSGVVGELREGVVAPDLFEPSGDFLDDDE